MIMRYRDACGTNNYTDYNSSQIHLEKTSFLPLNESHPLDNIFLYFLSPEYVIQYIDLFPSYKNSYH